MSLEGLIRRSARLEQQRKYIRGQIRHVGSAMADTAIKGFNSNASCGFVITSYRVVLQPFGEAKTIEIEVFEAAPRPRRRDLDFSSAPELIEGELGRLLLTVLGRNSRFFRVRVFSDLFGR